MQLQLLQYLTSLPFCAAQLCLTLHIQGFLDSAAVKVCVRDNSKAMCVKFVYLFFVFVVAFSAGSFDVRLRHEAVRRNAGQRLPEAASPGRPGGPVRESAQHLQ